MSNERYEFLAGELISLGELDRAEYIYKKMLDANSNNITARKGLANIASIRGDLEGALALLLQIYNDCIDINIPNILEDIASIQKKLGRKDDASLSWYNSGVAYYNIGWMDKASISLFNSFLLRPDDTEIANLLIDTLLKISEFLNNIIQNHESELSDVSPFQELSLESWSFSNISEFYRDACIAYANGNFQVALERLHCLPNCNPMPWQLKIRRLQAICYQNLEDLTSANLLEREVTELLLMQEHIVEAMLYAQQYGIDVNWPSAIKILRVQADHYSWCAKCFTLLVSKTESVNEFSKIWSELTYDWQKHRAAKIVARLIDVSGSSHLYNPTLSAHLFQLTEAWLPDDQRHYLIEHAIIGLYMGAVPDYRAGFNLIQRWWHDYGIQEVANISPRHWVERPIDGRPLRIGTLDLANICEMSHYFDMFINPTLDLLPTDRFVQFLYCNGSGDLPSYMKGKNFTARRIDFSKPEAIDIVAADDLDILLLISGFGGSAPLRFLASRPARRLALSLHTYCGYGPALFDAAILDRKIHTPFHDTILDEPAVLTQGWPVLSHPSSEAPDVAPPPRWKNGFITFGMFNRPTKLTPHMAHLWCRILDQLPTARLAFSSNFLSNPSHSNSLLDMMSAAGIDPRRIDIIPGAREYRDRLALFDRLDISLDTYPFNGGMTTLESLWQGVPVVSRADETPMARSGLSILSTVGLDDLASFDDDAHVATVVALAQDDNRLDTLRTTLRTRMRASNMMNVEYYADEFERLMREILSLPPRQHQNYRA